MHSLQEKGTWRGVRTHGATWHSEPCPTHTTPLYQLSHTCISILEDDNHKGSVGWGLMYCISRKKNYGGVGR